MDFFLTYGAVLDTAGDDMEVTRTGLDFAIAALNRQLTLQQGSYNNQRTVITVMFRPDGAGTLMTLRQDGFAEAGLRDGYKNGWSGPGGSLDKLAARLALRSV